MNIDSAAESERSLVAKGLDKTVAIYGTGIAGLSAAHELAKRGWQVSVYETNADAGGFFRSARVAGDHNMPSEYSWHGMGPWYHNVFDLLRQIPFDASGSVYERALSRPIAFGLGPDQGQAACNDTGGRTVQVGKMFRMTRLDRLRWSWLLLKVWTANRRCMERYSAVNAAAQWRPVLTATAWSTWVACFGPWIGSDWTPVSLHHAGHFFRKQLFCQPPTTMPPIATALPGNKVRAPAGCSCAAPAANIGLSTGCGIWRSAACASTGRRLCNVSILTASASPPPPGLRHPGRGCGACAGDPSICRGRDHRPHASPGAA